MTSDRTATLSIANVFDRARYVVPIYQRAFAWREDQILTLLRDVHDYRLRHPDGAYYIGTLVTHEHARGGDRPTYEVVDGQQRLTTLYIVLATLGDMGSALTDTLAFEGRERSSADLTALARHGKDGSLEDLQDAGIKIGAEGVIAAGARGEFTAEDLEYLLHNVRIIRTTLPAKTDLNHYFEVMNSRGEQLEKHEIVKAALMDRLRDVEDPDTARWTFARIWDACSDMSRHVQARFSSGDRTKLFSQNWDQFECETFQDVVAALGGPARGGESHRTTLSAILGSEQPAVTTPSEDDTDATERYGAIIDFPNFLLHVLALSTGRGSERFTWSRGETPVPLDDKQLVELFKQRLQSGQGVTQFAFDLLRARYLFDRFVIKTDRTRESDDDSNWVLHRVRKLESGGKNRLSPIATFGPSDAADEASVTGEHEHVLMLQSMFQVTDSRRSYKNFLYAMLEFLFASDETITASTFIGFLAKLADERYRLNVTRDQLDRGTLVPHFAFNYLDYLLWRGLTEGSLQDFAGVPYTSFRFRYRTSVEHFYPQHPDPESQIERLDASIVDRFGNLCLMSRSENSKRSNLAPAAKINQYRSERQSLKFQLMAAITQGSIPPKWEEPEIDDHGQKMVAQLDAGVSASIS